MMEVKLINWTPDALETLIYTKNTRLQGNQSIRDIRNWSIDAKMEELAYMRDTIKSSWEFIDYIFEIKDVTRAFTHQLVRTRNGSFAQQSQRTVDVGEMEWLPLNTGDELVDNGYDDVMREYMANYNAFVGVGVPLQDARNLLPTGLFTNIIAKFNLRTLHEMANVRLCAKTQGEYQDVFKAMKKAVCEVHPWASRFIEVACVNTGVCIFPRFTECPIQKYTYTSKPVFHNAVKDDLREKWEEANMKVDPGQRGKV